MKSGANLKPRAMLAATVFCSLSLPLLAQQPTSPSSSHQPPASAPQTTPQSSTPQSPAAAPAAQPAAPIADLRPVQVELEQKLDSKTAKNGDSVTAQTRSAIKTADGTEIPKGSKLIGHVLAAQPANGQNSQVAIKFEQIQIKGGQSLPVQSQIESITPAGAAETASASPSDGPMSAPQSGGANGPRISSPTQPGATAAPSSAPSASSAQSSSPSSAQSGPPAAGTVVAQNGGINITTTAVPGVLLANNAPGQQDPRLARVSSILLGARRDIQLDSGTRMVVGVAAAGQ
ncbi:MAG TPA: hypothetical protein VIM62_09685 [Acidobacteriaceae bacterium]